MDKDGFRTSTVTDLALRARYIAAWPHGVRAADDVDVMALACGRFGQGRAVEHSAAGQLGHAGRIQLPVRHAGREDHGVRGDSGAVREPDDARRASDLQPGDLARGQYLGTELRGLTPGPVGELCPGHSVRKAEIVLDARALARLAAGRGTFHEDGPQALGGPVHRRTQSGRSAADDDEVVEVGCRGCREADLGGELPVLGLDEGRAVRSDHQREPLGLPGPRRTAAAALPVRRTSTSGTAPGYGPGTPVRPMSAPTSGARRPW